MVLNKRRVRTGVELAGLSGDRDRAFDPAGVLAPIDQIFVDQMNGDYEVYDALLQDSQVNACYQQRELAVTSKPWEVIPPGTESQPTTDLERRLSDRVTEYLRSIEWDEITSQMLRCRHYGFRIAELLWQVRGGEVQLPHIKVRRNQRFRFGADLLPRLVTDEEPDGVPVPEHNFWWITSGASHGDDPYGVGGSALYWLVKIKQQALKAWLNHLETLTIPTVVGVHPPSASLEERMDLLEAAQAIADGAKAIRISDESVIKLLEATRSATTDYPALIDRMDGAIAKVILSQTMTTDDGSSLAQGQVHKAVRDEIVEADAMLVCESFNRQVIAPWVFWNWGPTVRAPRVSRLLEGPVDLGAVALRDRRLASMGFLRSVESVREVYGDGFVFVGSDSLEEKANEESTQESTQESTEDTGVELEVQPGGIVLDAFDGGDSDPVPLEGNG